MQTTLFPLSHYEFIHISGADSLSFLQGQVSCNTTLLSLDRSLNGALCNLKGRVIADFRLLQWGEDYLLQCPATMADRILGTLGKYAVFSKVELKRLEADSAPQVVGLMGEAVDAALSLLGLPLPASNDALSQNEACAVIRLPGSTTRSEIWFRTAAARDDFLSRAQLQPTEDLALWQRADIEAGVIHVTPELSEEYTPQLLNYDISGLIDFKKGCYTGQEIVARMYYRGTAKKRLYLLSSSLEIGADSRVLTESDSNSEGAGGEVLRYSNTGAAAVCLAVLASEAVEAGESLRLSDKPESELRVESLPYSTASGKTL